MNAPTPPRPNDLTTPLWTYALALYRRPGVAPACLALQARLGLDVCVLIFALYASHCQRALSAASLAQIDQGLQAWRHQVVLPLRQLRQAIKMGVPGMAAGHTDWVREQVKAVELNAEQVALAYLDAQLAPLPHAGNEGHRPGDALQGVLAYFAQANGQTPEVLQSPEVRAAAEMLARQAQDVQTL